MSNTHPQRIQRKRTRGYSMKSVSEQLNGLEVVYVGRPSIWGNMFSVTQICVNDVFQWSVHHKTVDVLKNYRRLEDIDLNRINIFNTQEEAHHEAVNNFAIWFQRDFMRGKYTRPDKFHISNIVGKNLACFCSLEVQCHADWLLDFVNQ